MEIPTSFDLNRAIENWRLSLAKSPAFRTENLYELETHLRDAVVPLRSKGLSDEEAFIVATRRIGKGRALEAEFEKVNRTAIWCDRMLWILIGSQLWLLAGTFSSYFQVLFKVSVQKINEWLAIYGLGALPETASSSFFCVIAFPMTIIAGGTALWLIYRWSARRGWSFLSFLLQRPTLLAVLFALLCAAPTALSFGTGLLVKKYGLERVFSLPGYSPYIIFVLLAVHTLVFTAIVSIIARKRLLLNKA